MPFTKIPGLKGKVFVPEACPASSKKHPCRDCFGCQRCSDDRCSLCRAADTGNIRSDHSSRAPKT